MLFDIPKKPVYVLDSKAIIFAPRLLSKKRLPQLCDRFKDKFNRNDIVSVREVKDEVMAPREVVNWCRKNKRFFPHLIKEQQDHFKVLLKDHPPSNDDLIRLGDRDDATLYVVAKAQHLCESHSKVTVLSHWRADDDCLILEICKNLQIPCIAIEEFCRAEFPDLFS